MFSWTDPELKGKKLTLNCSLDLISDEGDRVKTLHRMEVRPDNLKFKESFIGKFMTSSRAIEKLRVKQRNSAKGLSLSQRFMRMTGASRSNAQKDKEEDDSEPEDIPEKMIKISVETDGQTNILRLTEKRLDELVAQVQPIVDEDQIDTGADEPAEVKSETKIQVDVPNMIVSLIAKSDKKLRREFMLAAVSGIEFLKIESEVDTSLQLKMADF